MLLLLPVQQKATLISSLRNRKKTHLLKPDEIDIQKMMRSPCFTATPGDALSQGHSPTNAGEQQRRIDEHGFWFGRGGMEGGAGRRPAEGNVHFE
jgi:hypothetical protein